MACSYCWPPMPHAMACRLQDPLRPRFFQALPPRAAACCCRLSPPPPAAPMAAAPSRSNGFDGGAPCCHHVARPLVAGGARRRCRLLPTMAAPPCGGRRHRLLPRSCPKATPLQSAVAAPQLPHRCPADGATTAASGCPTAADATGSGVRTASAPDASVGHLPKAGAPAADCVTSYRTRLLSQIAADAFFCLRSRRRSSRPRTWPLSWVG